MPSTVFRTICGTIDSPFDSSRVAINKVALCALNKFFAIFLDRSSRVNSKEKVRKISSYRVVASSNLPVR